MMSGYNLIVVHGPYRLPEIRELEGHYEDEGVLASRQPRRM
jgi:hypothetical protein